MYKLPENLDSKYKFVTLASKRAEQLQMGALPKLEDPPDRKSTVLAQQEVATGAVEIYDPATDAPANALLDEEE